MRFTRHLAIGLAVLLALGNGTIALGQPNGHGNGMHGRNVLDCINELDDAACYEA